MTVKIITGDCREVLATLPAESVHCVVTSPPYWGLRDYGVAGQIGLDPTYQEFVDQMVAVFREMRRVLRADGTLWLNLGDSYAGSAMTGGNNGINASGGVDGFKQQRQFNRKNDLSGLKPKDLCGIPWRVAFALQADGWWLRQDIIWSKPNPMPESVTDRCTKAHEYVFLLSKSERYFYDAEAIKEAATFVVKPDAPISGFYSESSGRNDSNRHRSGGFAKSGNKARKDATERGCPASGVDGSIPWKGATRNKRSVWEVATQPFSEAHFATFPPALIEPCILAGCPKGGTVLDPFGGAGTTGLVADRLQRDAILIELNSEYAAMSRRRIEGDSPLFVQC